MALLDDVEAFFGGIGWRLEPTADGGMRVGRFEGESGKWPFLVSTREQYAQVMFYSIAPEETEAPRRAAMAELLARINWNLVIGNFEMDMSDGEVRFKTSVDVEDIGAHSTLLRNLAQANVLTMDRYLPTVRAVQGGATVEDALAALEG